jgi:hypothetical protein
MINFENNSVSPEFSQSPGPSSKLICLCWYSFILSPLLVTPQEKCNPDYRGEKRLRHKFGGFICTTMMKVIPVQNAAKRVDIKLGSGPGAEAT